MKDIKDFILVFDAFGSLPIVSLQDPIKEAEKAYMIYPNRREIFEMPWYKHLMKALKPLDDIYEIYITGKIKTEYWNEAKDNIVTDLAILSITLRPHVDIVFGM